MSVQSTTESLDGQRHFLELGKATGIVSLIVDNCPAHPEVLDLQSIKLIAIHLS